MYNDTRRAAWVEIDLGKITDNYKALSGLAPGAKTIPCLKADAYGHGAIKVAWELIKAGADYIGVATLFEAVELRQAGIGKPIVLLGPTPRGNTRDVIDLNILSIITTYEDAWLLSETATRIAPGKTIDVFIALDTGMGRIGFLFTEKDLDQITQIAALPNLKITGLLSHFSAADEEDLSFSEYQLGRLKRFEEVLADRGIRPEMTTIANSAGIIHLPASHLSAIRPGISLYGFAPNEDIPVQTITLEPAMQVKANIVFLKKVPSGFSVGYGRNFVTERNSLIATLPLGYADGLARNLSGKARVLVRGQYAPIVGNICMDQCMVDVTEIPDVSEYDEVVILGEQAGKSIPAEELARLSGTINHEVTCRFGQQRLPKVYKSL